MRWAMAAVAAAALLAFGGGVAGAVAPAAIAPATPTPASEAGAEPTEGPPAAGQDESTGGADLEPLAGADRVALKLASCNRSCWLADLLLPSGATTSTYPLAYYNPGATPIAIRTGSVSLFGETSRSRPPEDAVALPSPLPTILAASDGTVALAIRSARLEPDRYTGSVFLGSGPAGERLAVPVDIAVRAGPVGPLLMLLLGLLVGQALKLLAPQNLVAVFGPAPPGARNQSKPGRLTSAILFNRPQGVDPARGWLGMAVKVVLLLLLWLIGASALYVRNAETLGAAGVIDYLPLLLWGFSADIASRTLTTLPDP